MRVELVGGPLDGLMLDHVGGSAICFPKPEVFASSAFAGEGEWMLHVTRASAPRRVYVGPFPSESRPWPQYRYRGEE